MGLRSFFGVLPPKLPYVDAVAPPEALPMPSKVTLLWAEEKADNLAVQVGDGVKTGQDLVRNGGGALVATVSGHVESVEPFPGPEGYEYTAVTIIAHQTDSIDPSLGAIEDFSDAEPVELRAAIARAGFATLSSVETLVVSALDLDPLSLANQQAFRDSTDQVEAAIRLLTRATGVSRAALVVPDNLRELAGRQGLEAAIEVIAVPGVYPNGLPEILARKWVRERPTRSGSNAGGGILVVGVEHAVAMVSCLQAGVPLLEKTVSFSTGGGGKIRNFRVRIGAPVADLLQYAGVELQPRGKVIVNGIMRGYACFTDAQPVTVTTDSVHVQEPAEVFSFENTTCTNCGRCNAICPVDLEVNLLGRFSEYGIYEKCRDLGAENCVECGLCAYICPARRPLVQYISHAKHVVRTEVFEDLSLQEALACSLCGPSCPAVRLIDTTPSGGDLAAGTGQED